MASEISDRALSRSVDRAVAEVNAAYRLDTDLQAQDEITGDAWRRLWEAETAVGPYGVVLPIALAQDLQRMLSLDDTVIPTHLLVAMLDYHVAKAATR